jgi:hypothetical protein
MRATLCFLAVVGTLGGPASSSAEPELAPNAAIRDERRTNAHALAGRYVELWREAQGGGPLLHFKPMEELLAKSRSIHAAGRLMVLPAKQWARVIQFDPSADRRQWAQNFMAFFRSHPNTALFKFGAPTRSVDGIQAMVYADMLVGGRCSEGGTFFLAKSNGSWKVVFYRQKWIS